MLMLSSCIALLPASHKCIPKLSCQQILYHPSHLWLSRVLLFIWPTVKFILVVIIRSVAFLSFSPPAAAATRARSSTQKSIPAFCTSSFCSSQPFIPFVTKSQFVSDYFWRKSASFSSPEKVSTRPPAAFPSPMQAKPSDLPLARRGH